MGRNPFSFCSLRTVFTSIAFLALLAIAAPADAEDLPLRYFKNYFVTGDYAVAGVGGLRGKGVGGFATGTINMTGVPCTTRPTVKDVDAKVVPCPTPGLAPKDPGFVPADPTLVPADIVAAFLYWETEETSSTPSSINGSFHGKDIVGKVLGSPNNPACLSSGGPNGTNQGKGRVYRADVLRYLPIDTTNNIRLANGPHVVKLRDSGGNGNGNTSLTNGATLVVVYRIVVPGQPGGRPGHTDIAPLRAVVSYDGAFTLNKFSDTFTLTMGGFYEASSAAAARMTPIVGNGQSNFRESLYISGGPSGVPTPTVPDPFTGATKGVVGGRWDNPDVYFNLKAEDSSYSTRLIAGNNQVCLTIAAYWTSTNVVDTDYDGLLNVWETDGMHLDPGDNLNAATFGGCSASQTCVDLKHMGADPGTKDIFVEIDWMQTTDDPDHKHVLHTHIPKYTALKAIGDTFAKQNPKIAIHFDVGGEYQQGSPFFGLIYDKTSDEYKEGFNGSPYIVPAAYARGGDVIEESSLLCKPKTVGTKSSTCAFSEPYSVLSWKKGFHAIEAGFSVLGIPKHFDESRMDIFHYALFSHALAGPFDSLGHPLNSEGNPLPPGVFEPPSSVSGVADRPGGDVMITLGLWRFDDAIGCDPRINCSDQSGSPQVQAGTLMHELGHNLALSHSGNSRVPNCVPIYQSVMNYLYQTRGLTDAGGFEHIDYSHGVLHSLKLDENQLPYPPSTALGALPYRVRFYGPPITTHEGTAQAYCGGMSNLGGVPAVRVESSGLSTPDWSRGVPGIKGNALDVNYDGSIEGSLHPDSALMADSDDWSSLNLQQVGSRRNVNGLSADIGEADLGEADLGEADLGEADLGEADLGEADLGEADLGEADLGEADLGEATFKSESSSPDATSADHPLNTGSTIDKIALDWGQPGIGQVRQYNIYRSDPDPSHPFTFLRSVAPTPNSITFDDPVNDLNHSRGSCVFPNTCFNTTYTYYITSVVADPTPSDPNHTTESGASAPNPPHDTGEVKHLFVIPDDQTAVYGAPLPLTFTVYGDGTLDKSLVSCVAPGARNAGSYAITCSGPATSDGSNSIGVTYNTPYFDGPYTRTPGKLTITKAPLTIAASTNTRTFDATTAAYDGTTAAAAVPVVSGLQYTNTAIYTLIDTVTSLTETYDTRNAGGGKTLSVSPGFVVNDHNGGNNYTVTLVPNLTGVINKANATVTVNGYTGTFDAASHGATGSAIGVTLDPSAVGSSLNLGASFTNVPGGTAYWTFTGGTNYFDQSGNVAIVINKANATVTVNGYMGAYDALPHGATGSVAGVLLDPSAAGSSLNFGATFTNATGGTAHWVFTGGTNYNNRIGDVAIVITKVTPAFSNLSSASIIAGSSPTTLGGKLASGALIPSGLVKITVNSVVQSPAILAGGLFSASFATAPFAVGNYPISYHYDGDMNFNPPADGAGTLTVMGFTRTGSMIVKRSNHTATLLPDGTVLMAGGFEPGDGDFDDNDMLSSAEVYNPVTGISNLTTGSMPTAVARHTATLLGTGKVLIAGGRTSTAGLYNPATKTFAATGTMSTSRSDHTATLLPNGKVLITGGANNSNTTLNTATLYDPATGTFSATGSMTSPRELHTATLVNGKVLIAGGRKLSGSSYVALSSAEVYDPATGVFTATVVMPAARYGHIAVLLSAGKVLIAGGTDGVSDLATAVLFDAGTGSFSPTGNLVKARRFATATVLNDGRILVTGGRNGSTTLNSAELYSAGTFSLSANMGEARYSQTATLLNNGKVLVTGGVGSAGLPISSDELFNSGP